MGDWLRRHGRNYKMSRPILMSLLAFLSFALASCRTAGGLQGLAGTWTLVRAVDVTNGGKDYYGPAPKGRLMFDANQRYSLIVLRSDLPDYAPKDKGTDAQNRAVVQGSIANYGTYQFEGNEILLSIGGSTFKRWEVQHGPGSGSQGPQRRPFRMEGNRLTYTVKPSSNGGVAEFVWERERQR